MQSLMPDQIFISYAHEDRASLEQFLRHLDALNERSLLRVWSDEEISAGSDWHEEIRQALARARIALLLVSPEFLRSRFIRDEELAPLWAAYRAGHTMLYWVALSQSVVTETELGTIQALTPEPLCLLSPSKREAEIIKVCKRLHAEMGQLTSLTRDGRTRLGRALQMRLGEEYRLIEELETGASSICYKAEQHLCAGGERLVVVKTPVLSELHPDAEGGFTQQMNIARSLSDPAYIRLLTSSFEANPAYVVTEYIEGRSLTRYLESNPFVPPRNVRIILLYLARALREAHAAGYLHEGLMPSNVLIDREHRPRVSAFRFLGRETQANPWGSFVINHEICSYLSPEQFEGKPRTELTDQYALGLLGHELLAGRPIPRVTRPADFADRRSVYEELASGAHLSGRPPELCGVVLRMLSVKPGDRWRSMSEVVEMLENVPVVDSFDESYRRALSSYARFQAPDKAARFCEALYANLFQLAREIEPLFKRDKALQYRMLNQAIKILIDYAADPVANGGAIDAIVASHRGYRLTSRQLCSFLEAFTRALRTSGETDPQTLDAWHEVLIKGLRLFGLELDEVTERESMAPTLRKPLAEQSLGPGVAPAVAVTTAP